MVEDDPLNDAHNGREQPVEQGHEETSKDRAGHPLSSTMKPRS